MKLGYLIVAFQICFALTAAPASKGEPDTSVPSTGDESEFKLEPGLIDKMYQQSVTTADAGGSIYRKNITLIPSVSFLSSPQVQTKNDYFVVPYENLGTVPVLTLEAAFPFIQTGSLDIFGTVGAGYSYKEGVQQAQVTLGGDPVQGVVKLHWVPIYVGTRIKTALFGLNAVKPHVVGRAGMQWLYQSGTLDGLERGFWVPFFDVGGGVSLFESETDADSWFGGLSLSLFRHEGLSSEQTVKSWMFEAGMQVWL
jgi:hypothetical protein